MASRASVGEVYLSICERQLNFWNLEIHTQFHLQPCSLRLSVLKSRQVGVLLGEVAHWPLVERVQANGGFHLAHGICRGVQVF